MNAEVIGGRICGMRARRVGHRQTSGTAVRGIGAHFGRQELSSRSDENPIYGIAGDKPYVSAGPDGKQWERRLKGAWEVERYDKSEPR
jgi:hypothetical protein